MKALEIYHIKYATIQPDSPLGITFSSFNFHLSIFNFKERSTWNTPYKFSGKELDDETGYSYFGARYYDPNISIWLSVDPLSDEAPGWTPYRYAFNNPIKIIDPNGMFEDWVQNEKSGQYVWKDNVTSKSNTPIGYRYIGPENQDIIEDLNIPTTYDSRSEYRYGAGLEGGYKSKGGAPVGTAAEMKGRLSVSADVSHSKDYVTDSNKNGKYFRGVIFQGDFSYKSISSKSDLRLSYDGTLGISYGDKYYSGQLSPLVSSMYIEAGTSPLRAYAFIPAADLSRSQQFNQAQINVGATNPNLFIIPRPVSLTWPLRKNSVLSPSN